MAATRPIFEQQNCMSPASPPRRAGRLGYGLLALCGVVARKAYPLSDPLSCYFLAAMTSISTRTSGLIN